MHACMYACMCVCMYVCMYACMHVCMYVHVCMYTCMYVCMYVCMYACRDKTTINFQYIYHKAFWLLENSTTLRAPDKCQIQIDSVYISPILRQKY